MQDLEKEQTMSDTCGHTSKKLLGFYDHNSSSWRMYEATLDLDLEKSLATLPLSGMTQHGDLYELQMSEHHTEGSDSSFLPTPMSRDYKGVAGRDMDLNKAVLNIPTPTASDGHWSESESERAGIKGNHNLSLVSWSRRLLPTPTAMHVRNHDEPVENYEQRVLDYEQGKTKGKPGKSTGIAVRLLATPVVNASHQSGTCRNWGGDLLHDVKCTCLKYRLHWTKVN